MVAEQIAARGLDDPRVLDAMRAVPRHHFVPPELLDRAYDDTPLPIGGRQTISQPYIVALMTSALRVAPGERVLEVGTGSGYQAAVLAAMGAHVVSIERLPELAGRARETLAALGLAEQVVVELGDGTLGWPAAAPYDAILVTAGGPNVPRPLLEQLAPAGRLVLPVGEDEVQVLVRLRRDAERLEEDYLGGCRFVRLVGRHGWSEA
jgi:protein-L-isoaspartate(D-aspartate) O-methyltransferase